MKEEKTMNHYEKPQFKFEELKLFERVADKCWGESTVWLDVNNDNIITSGLDIEFKTAGNGGCQGQNAANDLNSYIKLFNNAVSSYNISGNAEDLLAFSDELYTYVLNHDNVELNTIAANAEANWCSINNETSTPGIIVRPS